jgi:hypothetical protein
MVEIEHFWKMSIWPKIGNKTCQGALKLSIHSRYIILNKLKNSYFRACIIAQLDRLSYKNRVCFSQASQFFYLDGRRFIYSGALIIPAV